MKNLLILTLTLLTFSTFAQRGQGDSFVEYYTAPDKLLHGAAGFSITGIATHWHAAKYPDAPIINSAGFGFLIGWGAGGLKELSDWKLKTGTPDHGDVMATAIGAAVSAGVNAAILKYRKKRAAKRRTVEVVDFRTGNVKTITK